MGERLPECREGKEILNFYVLCPSDVLTHLTLMIIAVQRDEFMHAL